MHDINLPATTDAYIQRAGTWTLYQHLKEFNNYLGKKWQIIGVQSCGDLTMNPWHLAYVRNSYIRNQQINLCCLLSEDESREPFSSRIYRCIVKWDSKVLKYSKRRFEALDLTFHSVPGPGGVSIVIEDTHRRQDYSSWLNKLQGYDSITHDIAPFIDFALAGKPLVINSEELSLSNAIDRFQDVRHIFNLPTVRASGAYKGQPVHEVNFGEYQLFRNLNERRAALSSAVIVDLSIGDHIRVSWKDLESKLRERHFKPVVDSPTRRGQFRKYSDDTRQDKAEIFFPHNVYPFGVLGLHEDELVCLASGGLSGRVGNTLEGISRIMFDFFGCDDAMVLDEGYDTFQIINPLAAGLYKYTNDELIARILSFTKEISDDEQKKSLDTTVNYKYQGGLKLWPLNKSLFEEIEQDFNKSGQCDYSDVLSVRPHRSQMRSVLIFAVPQDKNISNSEFKQENPTDNDVSQK